MLNNLDTRTISIIAVIISIIALLFGRGIALRLFRSIKNWLQERQQRQKLVYNFIRKGLIWCEGMPAFIKKYWGLDKSLPNYPVACPTMRTYHPILNTANASLTRAQDFYVKLSQNQGRLGSSVEDCLSQFSNLRQEFEKDAQACLKEVFLIDIHKWKKLNQQKSNKVQN